MAWSYRQDRSDEVYAESGGPAILTEGEQQPETPSPEMVKDKKLRDKKPEQGVLTNFQQFPGQNVPRIIVGEGETEKDKEIVKAAKANDKDKVDPARQEMLDRERTRIRAEEQMKADADELEKEREKMRKEIQQELKKNEKKEPATPK
jgi:hypothetical protein